MAFQKIKSKIFVIAVFLIILCPTINDLTIQKDAGFLVGVNNEFVRPKFTLSSFFEGTYQKEYDTYYSHSFSGYRFAVRILNELRFRAFGKADNIIRCKDGSVIFENYIEEYLGLSETHYCTPEYLEKLTSQLKQISNLAENSGKQVIVLITPNKAEFIKDKIPDKYYRMKPYYSEENRGRTKLIEYMSKNNIAYVDCAILLLSQKWPFDVFPETGIHWTREAGIQALDTTMDCIEECTGEKLKRIFASERVFTSEPRRGSMNNDDDLWQLMNIISKKTTEYSYPIEEEFVPEEYSQPTIFVQGGSFSWTIIELLYNHNIAEDVNFLYYDVALYGYDNSRIAITGFSDALINNAVKKSDLIILEVNEEAIWNMGSGFYPYLEEMLTA